MLYSKDYRSIEELTNKNNRNVFVSAYGYINKVNSNDLLIRILIDTEDGIYNVFTKEKNLESLKEIDLIDQIKQLKQDHKTIKRKDNFLIISTKSYNLQLESDILLSLSKAKRIIRLLETEKTKLKEIESKYSSFIYKNDLVDMVSIIYKLI